MTDKHTTAELIEFLDDIIEDGECGLIAVMMDADEGLPLLKQIREILELQARPDEELVEKIVRISNETFTTYELRTKLHALLQSRQPVVTREEIEDIILSLSVSEDPHSSLAKIFKTMGVQVSYHLKEKP